MKIESYLENCEKVEQKNTAWVDKNDKVCDIMKKLQPSEESYLKHRSHVSNIDRV